jgi:hypothetical protein
MTKPFLIRVEHFGLAFIDSDCAKLLYRGPRFCLILVIP